jgi:CRISPR-associated protein Cas2
MSERDFYVLAYDMADDRRRAKIAKLMESLGERVQGSVFEAYLTQPELDKLLRRAAKVMDAKQDSLRVYFLCEACRPKIRRAGLSRLTPPPGVTII